MQSKFEKKFGKYAIKNLSLILVICYAIGYIIAIIAPGLQDYLALNPYEIIHNFQIWRLVSWLLIPPSQGVDLWILITLFFYYSIGTSLEMTWGTYRYNVYLFSGILFTIAGAFVAYFISLFNISYLLWSIPGYAAMFSTYYISMSIFLAYSATFPDAHVLLLFIIPVRVKYLGVAYGALLVYNILQYYKGGSAYFPMCILIIASLLNFVVFFVTSRKKLKRPSPTIKIRKTQDRPNVNVSRPQGNITRHKCAQCGATEVTNPELQFRFCSKCNGNYEYCEKHIFTHIHVN